MKGIKPDRAMNKWRRTRRIRASPRTDSDGNRKKLYGITPEQYNSMLVAQGGVCAICFKPETFKLNGKVCCLGVDHSHITNKLRGLLCRRCNLSLGSLEDSETILLSMVSYLRRFITDEDLKPEEE